MATFFFKQSGFLEDMQKIIRDVFFNISHSTFYERIHFVIQKQRNV